MKTIRYRWGFVRRRLVVALVLSAMLLGVAGLIFLSQRSYYRKKHSVRKVAIQAKIIHGWLKTYADEHGGRFPTGDNANAAYRELFKINVGADEMQFAIAGDAWHKPARGGQPDGDIGGAPDHVQALETGENAFAYVSGLSSNDTARLPLIANAFTAQPGVWSKNKNERGGVFQGKYGIVCRVGGSSVIHELKDGEWMVKEKCNGQVMNIFTPGFEDANFTVLNPK
jgi:hypothetical protein